VVVLDCILCSAINLFCVMRVSGGVINALGVEVRNLDTSTYRISTSGEVLLTNKLCLRNSANSVCEILNKNIEVRRAGFRVWYVV
jgi:hypothetical protein